MNFRTFLTEAANTDLKIVKILKVEDTREYQEQGDRWVPIAGSGDQRQCDRCGRIHEVHATVELSDHSTAIVGTGCMIQSGMDRNLVMGLDSAAKRLAALKAEYAGFQHDVAKWDAELQHVRAMAHPPIEGPFPLNDAQDEYRMGDTKVRVFKHQGFDAERRDVLTRSWEGKRLLERGVPASRPREDKEYEREIAKLEKRLGGA